MIRPLPHTVQVNLVQKCTRLLPLVNCYKRKISVDEIKNNSAGHKGAVKLSHTHINISKYYIEARARNWTAGT